MNFYKTSLYGLALAFVASEASAAVRAVPAPSVNRAPTTPMRVSAPAGPAIRAPITQPSPPSPARAAAPAPVRSATNPTQLTQNRAVPAGQRMAFGSSVNRIESGNNQPGPGSGDDIRELQLTVRDLEREKANINDVYTREETDRAIADAIRDVEGLDLSGKAERVVGAIEGNLAGLDRDGNLTDSGIDASRVVMVGTNGRIDPSLYDSSNALPAMPNDGNKYALMASSDGTAVWVRVRDQFVRN